MIAQRGQFVTGDGVVDAALAGAARSTPSAGAALHVRFAGLPVRLEGLAHTQRARAVALFGALAREQPERAVDDGVTALRVVPAPAHGFRVIDTRGWTNTMALEHAPDHVTVIGRGFVARVAVDGDAVLATADVDDAFLAPLENTLRVIVAYCALHAGGVLLHCAGLVDDAGARVCFGPSGAGKSTVARAWIERGRSILGDELCALERDGGWYVRQLPFAGDVRAALVDERVPLAGLHRLDQGPSKVERMPRAAAVTALCGCAPFVNADPLRLPALFTTLEALTRAHPVSRLTLALGADPRAVVVARDA